jgi:hypothetical protein
MSRDIYKYEFSVDIPIQDVEQSLDLSVLTAESLHGRPQVRLDASFYLDRDQRACIIDAGTEVGRNIASIFTGYLTREFGEDSFKVKRLAKDREPNEKSAMTKQDAGDNY